MTRWHTLPGPAQVALAWAVNIGGHACTSELAALGDLEAAGLVHRDADDQSWRATDLGAAVYHQRNDTKGVGMSKIVMEGVDKYFRPPNAGKAARRQVFIVAGSVLLVLAALNTTGPLMWLLWAWVAYRGAVFAFVVTIGPQLADEMTARLNALPAPYRRTLDHAYRDATSTRRAAA